MLQLARPRRYKTDQRKQSLYLPASVVDEMRKEAWRQDRPISWIVQQAWLIAKARVRAMPTHQVP